MLEVKAPGRICLFGEHQDYLSLPVIASAVSRYITIRAEPAGGAFELDLPDLGQRRTLSTGGDNEYSFARDYLASGVNVLRRSGCRWDTGWKVTITGDIPQRAGVSSSSALVIAWVRFLLTVAEDARADDPNEVARLGHVVEVLEFDEPGGMMDHYAAAFGGAIYVDTRPPFACRRLDARLRGIILCYSGEPKATIEVLATARKDFTDALAKAWLVDPNLDPASSSAERMRTAATDLTDRERELLEAQWANAALTAQGLDALEQDKSDAVLGSLLTKHHDGLRKLGVSTPRIDDILTAAMRAGAVGGKVNGSGGGGCLFALAPGREERVMAAMAEAGGTPWHVEMAWPHVREE